MKRLIRCSALFMVNFLVVGLLGCTPAVSEPFSSSSPNSSAATPSPVPDDTSPYRIACIAPMTGNSAQYGDAYKKAIDLFVEDTNASGGINGKN